MPITRSKVPASGKNKNPASTDPNAVGAALKAPTSKNLTSLNGEGVHPSTPHATRQSRRGKGNVIVSTNPDAEDDSGSADIENAGPAQMSQRAPHVDEGSTSASIPDPKSKEHTVTTKSSKVARAKTIVPAHTDTNALRAPDSGVFDDNATPTQPKLTARPDTSTVAEGLNSPIPPKAFYKNATDASGGKFSGAASRPSIQLITQRGSSLKVCLLTFCNI